MISPFSEAELNALAQRALPSPTWQVNQLGQCQNVALFGAGTIGKMLVHELNKIGLTPLCFLDNNPKLWGTKQSGIIVMQPGSPETMNLPIIITSNIYTRPIVETILALGYTRWTYYSAFSMFAFCDKIIPLDTLRHTQEISQAWHLFKDSNVSANVFKQSLFSFVSHRSEDYPVCTLPQYFCFPEINAKYIQKFVDCGCYTGDTLNDWSNFIATESDQIHYYAIEPDPNNIAKLKQNIQVLSPSLQKSISIFPCACGDTPGNVHMMLSGSGSVVTGSEDPDTISVPVDAIDHLLIGKTVSTIKIDIEGFEMQALNGAINTIRTQRPLLMVCVYHKAFDLWQIPLWIDSLNLGYRFELRFHERKQLSEIVCYAIPDIGSK